MKKMDFGKWRRSVAANGAWLSLLLCLAMPAAGAEPGKIDTGDPVFQAVDRAHAELWRRFVDEYGILLDYVTPAGEALRPTPEECRDSKPNGLAWWAPTENGAFFNGLYLAALCDRWRCLGERPEDAARARQIAGGLLLLSRVGDAPGFIARGVAGDGRGHHPAGSDDQTLPWFYGLYRYAGSGIPTSLEKEEIVRQMIAVADALEENEWRMPCDPASFGNRGSFFGKSPVSVPRLLFVTRVLSELTGDPHWRTTYEKLRDERPAGSGKTRLEICGDGSIVEEHARPASGYHAFWTKASCQACLRVLRDLSGDPGERRQYEAGLQAFARSAATQIGVFRQFSNDHSTPFNHDWRLLNQWWRPQKTVTDFLEVAGEQSKHWHGEISPAKNYEAKYAREPLFAAWIVLLSGDPGLIAAAKDEIRAALLHYDWEKLNFSTFFAAECVYFEGVPHGL